MIKNIRQVRKQMRKQQKVNSKINENVCSVSTAAQHATATNTTATTKTQTTQRRIYETTDYNQFKFIKGNRECSVRKNLVEDLKKYGQFENPIMVNERMEIIDGQHRFMAAKEVGVSIRYFINAHANQDVILRVNTHNVNWVLIDFIKSYKDKGYADYIPLYELMANDIRTKTFPPTTIMWIVSATSGSCSRKAKDGEFKIKEPAEYNPFIDFMFELSKIVPMPPTGKFREKVIKAIHMIWSYEKTNKQRLFEKLSEKSPNVKNILMSHADQNFITKEIVELYNKQLPYASNTRLHYVIRNTKHNGFRFVD